MATTNWYVDTNVGGGGNDGTSTDDAWQDIKDAHEYNAFTAANTNKIWIKRDSSHTMAADIAPADDGFADKPILFIGWPRPAIPNTTITEGEFTNGSNVVDNVVGITIKRTSHEGRFITAPDGEQYLITAILYESGIDGMAGGEEFTIGSKLTNTTQTKYGKIWGFTDDTDTTGTIQYVRCPSSVFVENDNITDADGGDAEIDAGAESAVGFLIDREYAGSTVSGVSGKFQIEADEDYAEAQAIDDSGFTIKLSTWSDDAVDLPYLDGDSAAFQILMSQDNYYGWKNLEFLNFADAAGCVNPNISKAVLFQGCLIRGTSNVTLTYTLRLLGVFNRCIIVGSGAGASQYGAFNIDSVVIMKNCAVYNCGGNGIWTQSGVMFLDNVNVGIEIENLSDDFFIRYCDNFKFKDVMIGGSNGYFDFNTAALSRYEVNIENYQKVLGDHKTFFEGGEYISTAVSGETPNKKLSDTILKITPNRDYYAHSEELWKYKIPLGEINADAGSQTFKFWLYNDTGVTLNDGDATADICLQADYVKSYEDASEYTMATATSAEHTIADAADADDWDSLSITINPAVKSKVRLYLRISKYTVNDIFIDRQVVIT